MNARTAPLPGPNIAALLRDARRRFQDLRPRAAGEASLWALPSHEAIALIRRSTLSRVVFSAVVALIALPFAPLGYLAAWTGGVIVWEIWARPLLEDRLALQRRALSEKARYRVLAAIHLVGSLGYCTFPIVIWQSGEAIAMVLAAAWICASANHHLVYYSSNRLLLASVLAPLFACGLATPFAASGAPDWSSVVGALCLLILTAAGGIYGLDRIRLAQSIAAQTAARAAAEKANSAKSRFLSMMSHELRTPLNVILGYAELIEEEASGSLKKDAREISIAGKRLFELVNVMLDVSRLEAGEAALQSSYGDIQSMFDLVCAEAATLARANNNTLIIAPHDDLGDATLDFERLRQCLMHLVSNAAKFTRDGEIRIAARRERALGRERFVCAVSDTGVGIAPERQADIFEPFVQGDSSDARKFEGSGLGLSSARQFARLMGGDVACESAPGRGATFTLWVDVTPAGAA